MSTESITVRIGEEQPIYVTLDGCGGGGGGDMFKSTYDTDDNGVVDRAGGVKNDLGCEVTAQEICDHINNEEIHRIMNYDIDYKAYTIEE